MTYLNRDELRRAGIAVDDAHAFHVLELDPEPGRSAYTVADRLAWLERAVAHTLRERRDAEAAYRATPRSRRRSPRSGSPAETT